MLLPSVDFPVLVSNSFSLSLSLGSPLHLVLCHYLLSSLGLLLLEERNLIMRIKNQIKKVKAFEKDTANIFS